MNFSFTLHAMVDDVHEKVYVCFIVVNLMIVLRNICRIRCFFILLIFKIIWVYSKILKCEIVK